MYCRYKSRKLPLISEEVYNEIFNDYASEQVFYEVVPSSKTGKFGVIYKRNLHANY